MSCIVPVYNGESFVAQALDSILSQTVPPLEIIVVDDGSTDYTPRVLEAYAGRVKVLTGPNEGPGAARNRGIAAATGEYLAFLDADDVWHPEKLARQIARFTERPDLDISVTMMRNFWIPELAGEAERHAGKRYSQPFPGYGCSTLLVRRDVVQRVGGYSDMRLSQDTDWFLRAKDAGMVIELLPDVLALRRIHGENLSHVNAGEIPDALLDIVRERLARKRAAAREMP